MKLLDLHKMNGTVPFALHEFFNDANRKSYAENLLKKTSEAKINEIKTLSLHEVYFISAEDFEIWEAYKLVADEDIN